MSEVLSSFYNQICSLVLFLSGPELPSRNQGGERGDGAAMVRKHGWQLPAHTFQVRFRCPVSLLSVFPTTVLLEDAASAVEFTGTSSAPRESAPSRKLRTWVQISCEDSVDSRSYSTPVLSVLGGDECRV